MTQDPILALLQTSPGLALIVAATVYILQQTVRAVKTLLKISPEQRAERNSEKLAETLDELGINLKLLNEDIKHHAEISNLRHTQVLEEVRAIRSKLS